MQRVAVLGISPGRASHEASGIALWQWEAGSWRSVRIAPSLDCFLGLSAWGEKTPASALDPQALLVRCAKLLDGRHPDVVAVAIPVARTAVLEERHCDRWLRAWRRGHGCPIERHDWRRCNEIGGRLYRALRSAGYRLAVEPGDPRRGSLIEVDTHAALLALCARRECLRYEWAHARRYWPNISAHARRILLHQEWRTILWRARKQVRGIDLPLPDPSSQASLASLRPLEKAIEAIACAWMATRFLGFAALPVGDEKRAIWLPAPHGAATIAAKAPA